MRRALLALLLPLLLTVPSPGLAWGGSLCTAGSSAHFWGPGTNPVGHAVVLLPGYAAWEGLTAATNQGFLFHFAATGPVEWRLREAFDGAIWLEGSGTLEGFATEPSPHYSLCVEFVNEGDEPVILEYTVYWLNQAPSPYGVVTYL